MGAVPVTCLQVRKCEAGEQENKAKTQVSILCLHFSDVLAYCDCKLKEIISILKQKHKY
jgi:hypothetical protein